MKHPHTPPAATLAPRFSTDTAAWQAALAADSLAHVRALPGLHAATAPVPQQDPGSRLPADWYRGAFMQVFVRAYADSDHDGIGDLRGLTSRLDYLADLGVRGLWLMPIHPSQDGDHGYAVTDYRAIAPEYGTLADFDALLDAAHARGMGVILDYVINHSAQAHPLFQASRQPGSPARDWYLWEDHAPAGWEIYGGNPWHHDAAAQGHYFAAFWHQMPDFNWRHPAVEAWHHDNLRFWLNRGVDGFRFDAVGHLVENGPEAWDCQPENYPLVQRVRALLDGYEHRFMVCEAPADPQGFAQAGGSAFAFDLNGQLIAAARGDGKAVQAVARYFEEAPLTLSTMLSNHDAFAGGRVADQLAGQEAAQRRAAALLLTLPGTPFVYYGEEIGQQGHPDLPPDPALRTPMAWSPHPQHAGFSSVRPFRAPSPSASTCHVAGQVGRPDSLHAHYQALIQLRRQRPSLRHGAYRCLQVAGDTLVFERHGAGETTVVAVGRHAAQQGHGLQPLYLDAAAGVAVFSG
ncbi:MAG: alpha-amylase family glycosyl hydrolase [Rubrivivax sp.]